MTEKLAFFVIHNWAAIDGWLASSSGIDPMELPIDRLLNTGYWWAIREADHEGVEKFNAALWRPPLGVVAEAGPWSAQEEASAFQALASSLNATATVSPVAGDAAIG